MIHPIGGTIFWYATLSRYVKSEVNICGIQDPAIEHRQKQYCQFESITEMAMYYIRKIKEQKPRGPYVLGGASSGGIIALEAARLLQEQGSSMETAISGVCSE